MNRGNVWTVPNTQRPVRAENVTSIEGTVGSMDEKEKWKQVGEFLVAMGSKQKSVVSSFNTSSGR